MTTTSFPLSTGAPHDVAGTIGWMAKRGVLLAFLQMPPAALVAVYKLGLVPFPVASFAVFVSSTHFRLVGYRTKVSDDPDEPVHLLHPLRPAGPGRGDGVDRSPVTDVLGRRHRRLAAES